MKGHGRGRDKDVHNRAADKLARESAKSPLSRKVYHSSARRKTTSSYTRVGSIVPEGQTVVLRVVETQWLNVQKKWKYRCEVTSSDSRYYGNMDWLYSDEQMRDGHCYEIELNDNPDYPQMVSVLREVEQCGGLRPGPPRPSLR